MSSEPTPKHSSARRKPWVRAELAGSLSHLAQTRNCTASSVLVQLKPAFSATRSRLAALKCGYGALRQCIEERQHATQYSAVRDSVQSCIFKRAVAPSKIRSLQTLARVQQS